MTREEFMTALGRYLKKLPEDELEQVRVYYHEMFEEAGVGRYDQVPAHFGDPKRIALEILSQNAKDDINREGPSTEEPLIKNKWIIIALGIMALPLGIPLLGTLLGGLIGIVTIVFALILAGISLIFFPAIIIINGSGLGIASIAFLSGFILLGIGFCLLLIRIIIIIVEALARWISHRANGRSGANHE